MGQSGTSLTGCAFTQLHICADEGSGAGLVLPRCGVAPSVAQGSHIYRNYSLDVSSQGRFLGTGCFSSAFRAAVRATPNETRIIRIVPRRRCERDPLIHELELIRSLDHPNFARVIEVVEDPRAICIVMEFVDGEDLLTAVANQGAQISETLVAGLTRQLMLGIQMLHNAGVAHCDVHPRNVIAAASQGSSFKELRLKLIDHGLAAKYARGVRQPSPLDWCHCQAPEQVLATGGPSSALPDLDPKCDVWAVGVTTYAMFSGTWPFDAESPQALRWKIKAGRWAFTDSWETVSAGAKSFVSSLLTSAIGERPAPAQALAHAFLQVDSASKRATMPMPRWAEIGRSLRRLAARPVVRQAVVEAMATHLTETQLGQFRQYLDTTGCHHNGGPTLRALRPCLVRAGVQMPGKLALLAAFLDPDQRWGCTCEALTDAALERRRCLEEAILWTSWAATMPASAHAARREEAPRVLQHSSPMLKEALGATAAEAANRMAQDIGLSRAATALRSPDGEPLGPLPDPVSCDDLQSRYRAATAAASPQMRYWLRTGPETISQAMLAVRMPPPPESQ